MGEISTGSYKELPLTIEQFSKLEIPGPEVDLRNVEFGFQFRCIPHPDIRDIIVGKIVKGDELTHWGAGLCVPERGVNRFRVRLEGDADQIAQIYRDNHETALRLKRDGMITGVVDELNRAGFIKGVHYSSVVVTLEDSLNHPVYGPNHYGELRVEGIRFGEGSAALKFFRERKDPTLETINIALSEALREEEGWNYHSKNTTTVFWHKPRFPLDPV